MGSIKSIIKSGYKSLKSCISPRNNDHDDSIKKHTKFTDKQEGLKLMAENAHYRKLHGVAPPAEFETLPNTQSDMNGFTTILPNNPKSSYHFYSDFRELSDSSDDEIFFLKEHKWNVSFMEESKGMTKSSDSDEEESKQQEKPLTKLEAYMKVPEIIVTHCSSSTPLSNTNEINLPPKEASYNYSNNDLESLMQLVEKLEKENSTHNKVPPNTPAETELLNQDLDLNALLDELIAKFSPIELMKYELANQAISAIFSKEVIEGEDSLEDLKSFLNLRQKTDKAAYVEEEINANIYSDQAIEDALYSLIFDEVSTFDSVAE